MSLISRKGKRWTDHEEKSLLTLHLNDHIDIKDISLQLERTVGSVNQRLIQIVAKLYLKEKQTNLNIDIKEFCLKYFVNQDFVEEELSKQTKLQSKTIDCYFQKKEQKVENKVENENKSENENKNVKLCEKKLVNTIFEKSENKINCDKKETYGNLNENQRKVIDIVNSGNNIFLTGEPGTGKTYTVKYIQKYVEEKNKSIGITAMTGTAAVLLNGKTLHSFLGIGLGKKSPLLMANDLRMKFKPIVTKLKELDILLIDEVSMLDSELFAKISKLLSLLRRNDIPFGGVQMIFVGDFCQLPPINGEFCFKSDVWLQSNISIIELKENVRQNKDTLFSSLLSRARWGKSKMTNEDLEIIKNMRNTHFADGIEPTRLYPLNAQVDNINIESFEQLLANPNVKKVTFPCVLSGQKKYQEDVKKWAKLCGISMSIDLCIGAQVMITRNLDTENGLVNGTRGVICEMNEYLRTVKMQLVCGTIVDITYVEITSDDEDDTNRSTKILKFSALPLKYAWAISQHKSQGMTLDAIEIDLGLSVFENGQAYVALSRARTISSCKVTNFYPGSFKTHVDVKSFYESL